MTDSPRRADHPRVARTPAVAARSDDTIDVLISILDTGIQMPAYAHPGDAGVDLHTTSDIELPPGERCVVGTGIAIALPSGFAAFVHPRSGHAARLGLSLVNAPGTVDAGYRGEIMIIMINLDPRETIGLRRGDRIAQMVFAPIAHARFHVVDRLPGTHRAEGGLGSTGVGGSGPTASGDHGD